jgi:hypothetical protein
MAREKESLFVGYIKEMINARASAPKAGKTRSK